MNDFISKAQGDKNSALNRRQYELDMVKEYFGHAAATADEIATAKTLISKFRTGLQKGKADPAISALISATSNTQNIELVKELKTTMTSEEYSACKQNALKEKLASPGVFAHVEMRRYKRFYAK